MREVHGIDGLGRTQDFTEGSKRGIYFGLDTPGFTDNLQTSARSRNKNVTFSKSLLAANPSIGNINNVVVTNPRFGNISGGK